MDRRRVLDPIVDQLVRSGNPIASGVSVERDAGCWKTTSRGWFVLLEQPLDFDFVRAHLTSTPTVCISEATGQIVEFAAREYVIGSSCVRSAAATARFHRRLLPFPPLDGPDYAHREPILDALLDDGNRIVSTPSRSEDPNTRWHLGRNGWFVRLAHPVNFELLHHRFDFPPSFLADERLDMIADRYTWASIEGGSYDPSSTG